MFYCGGYNSDSSNILIKEVSSFQRFIYSVVLYTKATLGTSESVLIVEESSKFTCTLQYKDLLHCTHVHVYNEGSLHVHVYGIET